MYWESVGKRMRDVPPSYSYKYTPRKHPELFTEQGIPVVQSSKRPKLMRPRVTAQKREGSEGRTRLNDEVDNAFKVELDTKQDDAVTEPNVVADTKQDDAVKKPRVVADTKQEDAVKEPSITLYADPDKSESELQPTLNAEPEEAVKEPSITLYTEPDETADEPSITLNAELDETIKEHIRQSTEPEATETESKEALYTEPEETETERNISLNTKPDETEKKSIALNAEPDINNQEQTDNVDVNEPSDQNHVHDRDDDIAEEHMDNRDADEQDDQEEQEYEDQDDHNSDDGFSDDGSCEDTQEEMQELEELIPGLSEQYRLLGKIGEGTFSTVYKALDLQHERFDNNGWTMIFDGGAERRARVVAIKKIYVTSSPARIANEISILSDLRGSRFIAPLVTAMRREDQVVVVLPYFRNDDFRRFYMDMPVCEMRWYLASLVGALAHAHERGIMHRDIKPSNFLYDVRRRHGVLVDFGLAEREDDQEATRARRALQMDASTATRLFRSFDARGRPGVPRKDTRPGLRANRAGTRGFRAPEVLLKVARQAVAIDMWSVGVILLCLLTRRFPFFQSTDDTEALLEIAVLFGRLEMERAVAELGRTFLTNVPTVKDRAIRFESLAKAYNAEGFADLPPDVFDLLRKLLTLSPAARITAAEALEHPFIANRE
ncbi:Cell division control protein 7 [Coemansia sp. RSA 1822]|nr:Cell division control protein 7 [Coemansia sp. RSA 1822]